MPRAAERLGFLALTIGFIAAGCTSDGREVYDQQLPIFQLANDPVLNIGVVEGDPNYELHRAASAIELADGGIVVANSGTAELLFFDHSGQFQRRAGGRGDGPGEFRWLSKLYREVGDTVLALDAAFLDRLSVFDRNGDFVRTESATTLNGDSLFPADAWLYRRFWVLGALRRPTREVVRTILDRLPAPPPPMEYRVVRVAEDGRLWLLDQSVSSQPMTRWLVIGTDAQPAEVVETPTRFELYGIGLERLLGRWRDTNDIEYIRSYSLRQTPSTATAPAWLSAPASTDSRSFSAEEAERILDLLRNALVNMVMRQEQYYADHVTYADQADSLILQVPTDLALYVIEGHRTGWSAVATYRGFPRICGMAVGTATPAGWPEGFPRCGS